MLVVSHARLSLSLSLSVASGYNAAVPQGHARLAYFLSHESLPFDRVDAEDVRLCQAQHLVRGVTSRHEGHHPAIWCLLQHACYSMPATVCEACATWPIPSRPDPPVSIPILPCAHLAPLERLPVLLEHEVR